MTANRDQLTIGIVGVGTHGMNHARVLRDLGHEVIAADADPTTRATFESEFETDPYENPSELFESDVDAVIISTPTKFHEPVATSAFEAGLDVLVEKPLAHTVTSAERIAAAAKRTNQICMVGFHHRFRNACTVLEEYIEEGYLGDVTHIDAKFIRRRGVPGRGTWYTSDEIAGGGALMDVGSHALDLLFSFYDWPTIENVLATANAEFGGQESYAYLHMWGEDSEARMYDVEDSVNAFLEFDDGRTADIEIAWAANTQSVHSYDVRGTEAGASLDITNTLEEIDPTGSRQNTLELYEVRNGVVDHFVDSEVVCPRNDPYRDELSTFLDAVVSGSRPERNNVHQALSVQRAIDRLYDEVDY
ncbi:Gfo/Idh/MocA family oxidoreductase [Halostagnicola sp. A-GB9-2]|uniref:Gfo/Idh/MocA family protein n=1 Tax=Halostagnicola sp. A-GB9-2 TaxID=3048066 RepID=UPI0024BFFB8C|nr:Gfo/Idh/MocA family oxidoreductase [Halostagnicola sp. A-GB9-2]MDJ1434627.1 Gfo/Idh/MocA family oxidoreductase [Halostagnicola sp. A-GB9-2]